MKSGICAAGAVYSSIALTGFGSHAVSSGSIMLRPCLGSWEDLIFSGWNISFSYDPVQLVCHRVKLTARGFDLC